MSDKEGKEMKPGEILTIYEDPRTCTKPEGRARLMNKDEAYPDGLEAWFVKFLDEPTEIRLRFIRTSK